MDLAKKNEVKWAQEIQVRDSIQSIKTVDGSNALSLSENLTAYEIGGVFGTASNHKRI